MHDPTLYIANPDVSCREEGPDGALLFNPDTDQVAVINPTGLLIWQVLADPHTQSEVAAALTERCNNVPEGQVLQDVGEFLEQMVARGFVGLYQGVAI